MSCRVSSACLHAKFLTCLTGPGVNYTRIMLRISQDYLWVKTDFCTGNPYSMCVRVFDQLPVVSWRRAKYRPLSQSCAERAILHGSEAKGL